MDKLTTFLDFIARTLQVKVFPFLIKALIRLVLWTNKVEIVGLDPYYETVKKHPSIIILWHNRVVLGPNFFGEYLKPSSNYTAYVSRSRDGEWLALATESFKNGFTIRVPKKNKHESLRAFIKTLKKSVLLITPDGPRGPKYKIKPGVIFAASCAKAQIFPFSWSASKTWTLKSWDGLKIPKPFGRILIGFGDPFFVHSETKEPLDKKIEKAEEKLNAFKDSLNTRLASLSKKALSKSKHLSTERE